MNTQILFVQGGGEGTHDSWDNKLVDSLRKSLGPGYEIRYPTMPDEADPRYAAWKAALRHELSALEPGAILIGHSLGGAILINVLAERSPGPVKAIVLIAAPFIGAGGWTIEEIEPAGLAARLPRVPIFLYHGSADAIVPVAHVELYAEAIPGAHVRRLDGRDHQLNDDLADVARELRALA
jgi:predicted alpha/beta hydrolase family esterase